MVLNGAMSETTFKERLEQESGDSLRSLLIMAEAFSKDWVIDSLKGEIDSRKVQV